MTWNIFCAKNNEVLKKSCDISKEEPVHGSWRVGHYLVTKKQISKECRSLLKGASSRQIWSNVSTKRKKEVKETLNKIADYSNDEKQKAVNVYKFSLMTMFFIGFIIVLTEFALLVDFRYIIAESLPLLIGGCTCVIMTIKNGLWDTFSKKKITPARDAFISFIITSIASFFCYIMLLNRTEDLKRSITVSLCFFVATFLVGFVVLRFLTILSKNKGRKNKR